ncbi:MAG: CDP-glycerol glycerophosphotransferase family protein [Candidatus Omnitrophica bacterium]|nr:CDP-glycerol glycerophosphotransferase family protein [Candidatus Omnitrophota bacterium]MDD5352655.1 CDP-glycerol glycerophosphotransferase family protein [Candidatus Omnitrophota bacterium]MDD5550254.1 CDP-glycerol glycerophosphotransferase family protein [Candidatus Omnitrophota bacterium]
MFDKELIHSTKEAYLRFIANWPNQFRYKGENFKELFTINGDFSLWWLTEMQKKDPECSPVFENLCRLEKGDKPKKSYYGFKNSLAYYFLSRVKFLIYMSLKILIFSIFIRNRNEKEYILFVSLYPNNLRSNNYGLVDRYYLNLPGQVENNLGIKTSYVSFYYKSVTKLLKEIRRLRYEKIIFYESYLSFADIISAFSLSHLIKYIFLERKKGFKDSFNFKGKNVFDLFRDELRISFIGSGIPEGVLLSKAIERIVKQCDAKAIISFLEMYPYSRALYYGAKKGCPAVKTVAYQHATITSNKLMYVYSPSEISLDSIYIEGMPIPDYFIFQGKLGRDILIRSGYPENRCFLTGSPRFDGLIGLKKEKIEINLPINKKIVLVATSFTENDTREIIKIVFETAKRRDDCMFVFKAHHNCPVESMIKKYDFKNFIISDEDIHQLILRSDVLVTSYSMSADEAIALDCPSICIDTGVLIDMSSFFEIEAAPIVNDPDGLNSALNMIFYQPEKLRSFKERWPELIEASFYKVDGKAEERFIKMMKEVIIK